MDVRHLAFEDQLQFIDSDDYKIDSNLLNINNNQHQNQNHHHNHPHQQHQQHRPHQHQYLNHHDIQLDSLSVSYLSMSVLLFELNERQGCLGAANYSVIRTFSAVNVGQMVLQIRGFKIGSTSSASNILRSRLYNIAKSPTKNKQQQHKNNIDNNNINDIKTMNYNYNNDFNKPRQQQQQQSHQQHEEQRQTSICQGYGFTIFDCEPFDLEPNRQRKIRIAFNPDFTLTKSIVSLTILTNLDEEFRFALVASVPRNLLTTCNRSLPRPDWEPTMHLILAIGMVIMILVSILIAYLEAMLYLRSQQANSAQLAYGHSVTHSDHHSGGSSKEYERNNCSNHSTDTCNKDRSNGSGHGATAISTSISNHQHSSSLQQFNGSGGKSNNVHNNKNNSTSSNNKTNNICTQKRRKNSSTANSEKVPTSNKSIGSTNSDKKSSSPYAPIFQNLTNVIASPPPPLPTFDSEFDSLEFKKSRGKKSAKKSNSLNGSIASSDDIGNHNSLNQSQNGNSNQVNKAKANGKSNGIKIGGTSSVNGEREVDLQTQSDRSSRTIIQDQKGGPKDVFTTTSLIDEHTSTEKIKLYDGVKVGEGSHQEQTTVMPIQPPSSSSSTPSSSSSSNASPSSSASSSPPLSASSYGEYSLLGPGATFELPCLRVRSAQI